MTIQGYGCGSYGRTEVGQSKSDIEPRYYASRPVNHSVNNDRDIWLRFDTYFFSSIPQWDTLRVEISENHGWTFSTLYTATGGFLAPYDGVNSAVYPVSPQECRVKVHRTTLWPPATKIIVRVVFEDEYGQIASNLVPVSW